MIRSVTQAIVYAAAESLMTATVAAKQAGEVRKTQLATFHEQASTLDDVALAGLAIEIRLQTTEYLKANQLPEESGKDVAKRLGASAPRNVAAQIDAGLAAGLHPVNYENWSKFAQATRQTQETPAQARKRQVMELLATAEELDASGEFACDLVQRIANGVANKAHAMAAEHDASLAALDAQIVQDSATAAAAA